MALISLVRTESALVVIDVQEGFVESIYECDRVVTRCSFLVQSATLLGIPIIATTQNPDRLGRLHPSLAPLVGAGIAKMSFSCWGSKEFRDAVTKTGRKQLVVAGVETHICVGLTAQDLLLAGYAVAVCPDAVSASTQDRHKLGMERIRDAGVTPVHSEAAVYEWTHSADRSEFKEILRLVKVSR